MSSIIRGTNAGIRFRIRDDINMSGLTDMELHIVQFKNKIIKYQPELTIDPENRVISYKFTQEESLSFMAKNKASAVIIGKINGDRFETRPILTFDIEDTQKNEVL